MNTSINKAVVAILGGVVTLALAFGVDIAWATEGVVASIGMLITSGLVWIIPNKDV